MNFKRAKETIGFLRTNKLEEKHPADMTVSLNDLQQVLEALAEDESPDLQFGDLVEHIEEKLVAIFLRYTGYENRWAILLMINTSGDFIQTTRLAKMLRLVEPCFCGQTLKRIKDKLTGDR